MLTRKSSITNQVAQLKGEKETHHQFLYYKEYKNLTQIQKKKKKEFNTRTLTWYIGLQHTLAKLMW